MASLDPRQVKTRAALLNAAIELVDERDTAQISVTDLAERAGVTRKTLYLHFPDRDTLLQAAGAHRYEQALTAYHRSGAGGLEGTAAAVLQHVHDHRCFYRRLLSGSCGVGTYRAIQQFLAAGIGRAAVDRDRQLGPGEALFLSGGAMAYLIAWLDEADGDTVHAAAARLAALLSGYLNAGSATPPG